MTRLNNAIETGGGISAVINSIPHSSEVTGSSAERTSEVCKFLRTLGLGEYAKQSIQHGFDDLCVLQQLTPEEICEYVDIVGMAPCHAERLRAATVRVEIIIQ